MALYLWKSGTVRCLKNILFERVLNAFNQIEGPKAVLLANSLNFGVLIGILRFHVMFSGRIPCMVCLRKMRGISEGV